MHNSAGHITRAWAAALQAFPELHTLEGLTRRRCRLASFEKPRNVKDGNKDFCAEAIQARQPVIFEANCSRPPKPRSAPPSRPVLCGQAYTRKGMKALAASALNPTHPARLEREVSIFWELASRPFGRLLARTHSCTGLPTRYAVRVHLDELLANALLSAFIADAKPRVQKHEVSYPNWPN